MAHPRPCRKVRSTGLVPARAEDSHYSHGIVVKHRRDIVGRKLICCVADQQARLANGTITDHYASVRVSRLGDPYMHAPDLIVATTMFGAF